MAATTPPENSSTPGSRDAPGSGPPLADAIPPQKRAGRGGAAADDGSRRKNRQRPSSSRSTGRRPDMAALARQAVVTYLRDASMGIADQGATPVDGAATNANAAASTPQGPAHVGAAGKADGSLAVAEEVPESAASAASRDTAESVAWRAAAAGVATLDRIEAAAAKVEADIAAALQAQQVIRDGAGEAAEAAVRSAQSSWVAAGKAVEAETRAKVWLRRVEHCVALTVVLLVIAIVILVLTAGPLR